MMEMKLGKKIAYTQSRHGSDTNIRYSSGLFDLMSHVNHHKPTTEAKELKFDRHVDNTLGSHVYLISFQKPQGTPTHRNQ